MFVFILLGVVIAVVGLIRLQKYNHLDEYNTSVQAVCTNKTSRIADKYIEQAHRTGNYDNLEKHRVYRFYFSYEYKGKKYTDEELLIGYHDENEFKLNKKYTIYIKQENPSDFVVEGHEEELEPIVIIAPIMGIFWVVLLTIIYIAVNIRAKKKKQEAEHHIYYY